MLEKPWHRNASNLLVVNSILAAISLIVVQSTKGNLIWLIAGIIAALLFIISAEKITEALDEDNVHTYVSYFVPYNFGVLLLFVALVGMIRHYIPFSPIALLWVSIISAATLFVIWLIVWGKDVKFLICSGQEDYQNYIDELEGISEPKRDNDCWTRLFYKVRSRLKAKKISVLPHRNVYARLKPSPIHGIGAFAIRPIKKGTKLFPDDKSEIVWINEREIDALPNNIKELYEDFSIIKDGKYGCPVSFNQLTLSWYLNDSDAPNVWVDENYDMFALRDIRENEELTIDSSQFSKQPYKKGL